MFMPKACPYIDGMPYDNFTYKETNGVGNPGKSPSCDTIGLEIGLDITGLRSDFHDTVN